MIIGGLHKLSLIDYPGKLSAVIFTRGCNFRCPYCHNPELIEGNNVNIIEKEEVISFLNERRGKLDGVVLTGGEPTLQSDITDFLEKVKELGFVIKIDTNGSNPEKLRELIDKKLVDYIAMDIKAPLDNYKKVTILEVDTKKILESIQVIMNSNLDYEFRTTVVKSLLSKDDVLEIGEIIKSAKLFVLQEFRRTKTLDPDFVKEASYTREELEEIKISLERLVKSVVIR